MFHLCTTARISRTRQEVPHSRRLCQASEDTVSSLACGLGPSPYASSCTPFPRGDWVASMPIRYSASSALLTSCGGEAPIPKRTRVWRGGVQVRSCPRTGSHVARSARAHKNISTDTNTSGGHAPVSVPTFKACRTQIPGFHTQTVHKQKRLAISRNSIKSNHHHQSRCARGMARKMSGCCQHPDIFIPRQAFPETEPTCGNLVWSAPRTQTPPRDQLLRPSSSPVVTVTCPNASECAGSTVHCLPPRLGCCGCCGTATVANRGFSMIRLQSYLARVAAGSGHAQPATPEARR